MENIINFFNAPIGIEATSRPKTPTILDSSTLHPLDIAQHNRLIGTAKIRQAIKEKTN